MRIAILEDDPDQAELVSLWLEDSDHLIARYSSGKEFLRGTRRESFDLYIVDWLLPDISGIEVIEKLRRSLQDFTPVLVTTVKNEEAHIVKALTVGADDYLIKPIRRRELVARIDAGHRRAARGGKTDESINASPYMISPSSGELTLNGETVKLTNREFSLAALFFQNVGKVVSRGHLLDVIWGINNEGLSTRTVDTHVSRLRKKLQLGGDNGWKLAAIYQHGYRLEKMDGSSENE